MPNYDLPKINEYGNIDDNFGNEPRSPSILRAKTKDRWSRHVFPYLEQDSPIFDKVPVILVCVRHFQSSLIL